MLEGEAEIFSMFLMPMFMGMDDAICRYAPFYLAYQNTLFFTDEMIVFWRLHRLFIRPFIPFLCAVRMDTWCGNARSCCYRDGTCFVLLFSNLYQLVENECVSRVGVVWRALCSSTRKFN